MCVCVRVSARECVCVCLRKCQKLSIHSASIHHHLTLNFVMIIDLFAWQKIYRKSQLTEQHTHTSF